MSTISLDCVWIIFIVFTMREIGDFMSERKAAAGIQVIDRAVHVLDTIYRYPETATLKVIAADTSLSTSTAHRILSSLIQNKLVERDDQGHYRFGCNMNKLGAKRHVNADLRAVAMPVMSSLRDKLGETVNLTVREGDVLVYLDKASPNRMMQVQQLIGSRAPLHVTAVGKLMLGLGGEDEIKSYSKRTNLPSYTRNTLSKYSDLLAACQESVERGYGLDNEEAEVYVGCIGVLIYDQSGTTVGGLSVSAPISRRELPWADDLSVAGMEISKKMGYPG